MNSAVKPQHVLFANEPFLRKMLVLFLALMSVYTMKKILWKNYEVLEMELKMYAPVGPKFVFEKIKFKVLHYIQHDFIW